MNLKERIVRDLEEARQRTLALIEPVSEEDLIKQHDPIMSPIYWDLGHIGNFEHLWLVEALTKTRHSNEKLTKMYDALQNPRSVRSSLPLLAGEKCFTYLKMVREEVLDILEKIDLNSKDSLIRDGFIYNLVLQHEYQHNETILATLQLKQGEHYNPIVRKKVPESTSFLEGMVEVPGGPFLMGTNPTPFAYDNEKPEHVFELKPFLIDITPVTNSAFLEFVTSNGYERQEFWSKEGWKWKLETKAKHPKHWEQQLDDSWITRSMCFIEPLDPNRPVTHVCWYEAEAYARFVGKRLPTEAEWEKAASWDPKTESKRLFPWGDEPPNLERANLDQLSFGPAQVGAYPKGVSPYGCHQMIGDVWEWSSSDFLPYPGFQAFPYKEYSEVFFGPKYKVLRGGSWATRPGAIRNTFRNWDFPIRRQIFTGFRCAKDI